MHKSTCQLVLTPINNRRLLALCGPQNQHIQQIEKHYGVEILQRSNVFEINGLLPAAEAAKATISHLYHEAGEADLTEQRIYLYLQEKHGDNKKPVKKHSIHTLHDAITPRGDNQEAYLDRIRHHTMNFAIGPAGTGKTFLAVAAAVEALEQGHVQRLILVRPAVEAGENLGFLPGDLEEKVLPYLRPIYDALYQMLGIERTNQLIERNVIEIAPLAFMRGRTLNDAFIILDEAQNTTVSQMKMFLTRIGFGSTAVITGDVTQIDLPRGQQSGLIHAQAVLKNVNEISFTYFTSKDAVRHPLVKLIIEAYDSFKDQDPA